MRPRFNWQAQPAIALTLRSPRSLRNLPRDRPIAFNTFIVAQIGLRACDRARVLTRSYGHQSVTQSFRPCDRDRNLPQDRQDRRSLVI
ncbi:hypothetical protein [Baaleninema sp.]|uniref:hypothetical protein n=1 Tax=Baaleninema sp. TaxID=3101197 RepID=UPI003D08A78C